MYADDRLRAGERIEWLAIVHILLVGLLVACWSPRAPLVTVALGLVTSHTILLAIWAGSAMSHSSVRLIGAAGGILYFVLLTEHLLRHHFTPSYILLSIIGVVITSSVLVPLLALRLFGFAIRHESSSEYAPNRHWFTHGHLTILTLLIGCVVAAGIVHKPYFPAHNWYIDLSIFAAAFGLIGVLHLCCVLASKQPVFHGFVSVAVAISTGFFLAHKLWTSAEMPSMILAAVEALIVVLSLGYVRYCGYRFMRPPRHKQVEVGGK